MTDIQMDTSAPMASLSFAEEDAPAVELTRMPQQLEVREVSDDWTGISSPAERRKLQNRLNQRIYRRRRAAKPEWKTTKPKYPPVTVTSPTVHLTRTETQLLGKFRGLIQALGEPINSQSGSEGLESSISSTSNLHSPVSPTRNAQRLSKQGLKPADLRRMADTYEAMARRDFMLGTPRVDQLLTLVQFNVFRALLSNTVTLKWTFEWLECAEPISPWNLTAESMDSACPISLQPTTTQKTISHHPWIDLWPIPTMRDNLLLAGDSYDEDQLCNDLVEFCDISNEQTGLIVWGEPWDPAGWEVSETFVRNWAWTLKGCMGLLQSTNYWRRRRGEEPLIFDV